MHAVIAEYYVHALIFENYYAYHCVTLTHTAGEDNMDVLTYRNHYQITSMYVHNNNILKIVDRKDKLPNYFLFING